MFEEILRRFNRSHLWHKFTSLFSIKFHHYFISFVVFKCPYKQSNLLLVYAFTFCVPCCDVPDGFRIRTMFGLPLPPFFCRRAHVLFIILFIFAHSRVQHIFNVEVTWRCLIRDRNCLPFPSTWVHHNFCEFVLLIVFRFMCCVVLCFCFVCLRPVSCVTNVTGVSGLSILDYPFGFLTIILFCVLCFQCCQCLWTIHSWFSLRFSLECPFLISPSVSLTFIYCNIILHFLILHS